MEPCPPVGEGGTRSWRRGERSGIVLGQIQRLFGRGTVAGLSEGQLLARFVGERDEVAFEAIVARHGPMVLGICRRLLDDPHDVEDAFQATFLVLVQEGRARSATATCWRTGSTGSPSGSPRGRGGTGLAGGLASGPRLGGGRRGQRRRRRSGELRVGARRGGRPAAGAVPDADRALLLRRPDARRGGRALALPGRDGPQPDGQGPRAAPVATDPARARPDARPSSACGPISADRPGVPTALLAQTITIASGSWPADRSPRASPRRP